MSKILDNLYVAGLDETFKDESLKSHVTHFLNVASEIEISERIGHVYYKIGINDDDNKCDIRTILRQCIEWISKAIENGGIVCVHCLEGKSRSVCVCISYLCCSLGWDFDTPLNWLRSKRACIDIWPLYLDQLQEFFLVKA